MLIIIDIQYFIKSLPFLIQYKGLSYYQMQFQYECLQE